MIDLHTHSSISDGSDPPARVVELAATGGCSAVALTDHDRVDGLEEAAVAAATAGIDFVAGCEISCAVDRGAMHLLVYFLDAVEGPLLHELVALQSIRDTRNATMAERLQELGLPVTLAEVEAEAGGIGAGRPHAAAVLMRKGVVASIQEAFDKFLARGRPGYVEKPRLEPARAIALARQSSAVPVLAHPLSLELDPAVLDAVVAELASLGLAGVEAVYGRYAPEERAALVALARRHDLVATGGSDYHGTYKPDLMVGTGTGDLAVPDEALDRLRDRLRASE